jgi:hypothetical protein
LFNEKHYKTNGKTMISMKNIEKHYKTNEKTVFSMKNITKPMKKQ